MVVKSFRTNDPNKLISIGKDYFQLRYGLVEEPSKVIKIIGLKEGTKVFENSNPVRLLSEYLANQHLFVFSSEILFNFKNIPVYRRKFFDRIICSYDKEFLYLLNEYKKIRINKQVVLKERRLKELYTWNQLLANVVEKITEIKVRFVEKINLILPQFILSEDFTVELQSLFLKHENSSKILDFLETKKEKEIEKGYCLYGPHLDDFLLRTNNFNAKDFISAGALKKIFISLLMALENILMDDNITSTIIIDDINSELDNNSVDKVRKKLDSTKSQKIYSGIKPWKNNNDLLAIEVKQGKFFTSTL